jgi:branched-chain amino acid transport system permease protein
VYLLIRSAFGRALLAMRDDAIGYLATGRSVALARIYAYGIGAMLAGLAGNLFAHYATYIDPTGFQVEVSFLILTMVVVGGMGTLAGPVVGAFLLIVVPEMLRFVGLPQTTGGLIRQALYGLLLVLILFFRPLGLMGGINWGRLWRTLRLTRPRRAHEAVETDREVQP